MQTAAVLATDEADDAACPRRPVVWPQPAGPAALYIGTVMHARMKPVGHRFSYSVFNLLIDLDRLDEAGRLSPLFSVNRTNLLAFHEKDHLDDGFTDLRRYADLLIARAGIPEHADRIVLMCYPRLLGYVFNPLSVYYAYRRDGSLSCLIYEVRNTFGERHSYVCPVTDDEASPAGIRQERDKLFHVSPFIPMGMRYRFRMVPPGATVQWRILETDRDGPLLSATFSGKRRPLTTRGLLGALASAPLLTFKIIGGIHFEALRLWRKGVRPLAKPAPPARISFSDARNGEDR